MLSRLPNGVADQARRHAHGDRECEEGAEVLRGGHARDEEALDRGLKVIVEDGEAVSRFELTESVAGREDRQPCDVDFVTRREDDLIARDRLAVAQADG